jgi:hypothetical protein
LWLEGALADDHRPDRWGIAVDLQKDTADRLILRAWEIQPGAWDRPGVSWQLQKLLKRTKAVAIKLWRYGTRSKEIGKELRFLIAHAPEQWLEIAVPESDSS